jgi:hypothetical protein
MNRLALEEAADDSLAAEEQQQKQRCTEVNRVLQYVLQTMRGGVSGALITCSGTVGSRAGASSRTKDIDVQ